MKLNPDCLREVLLYLEENLEYRESHTIFKHRPINPDTLINDFMERYTYDKDEINYSVEKLIEAKYIVIDDIKHNARQEITYFVITDITWTGHDFLNNVRSTSVWNATKKGASKIGAKSISALSLKKTECLIK